MSPTRIGALLLRQYYLIRHNPTRLVQLFLWPLLDITLWGFVSAYVGTQAEPQLAIVLLGGIILWEFLIRVMYGISVTFFEDVWSRNFLNIFASPLSILEYVVSMIVNAILTTALSFAAMLLFAWVVFGYTITVYGFLAIPFLFVLFLTGIALGIVGVAIVLRYGPSAEWFVWPLPAIAAPFVGVFYPVETLPAWMQSVSQILPPTYVFEGVRAILAGKAFPVSELFIGAALGAFAILLSYTYFVSVYRRAIRTGLIARYSAETVS